MDPWRRGGWCLLEISGSNWPRSAVSLSLSRAFRRALEKTLNAEDTEDTEAHGGARRNSMRGPIVVVLGTARLEKICFGSDPQLRVAHHSNQAAAKSPDSLGAEPERHTEFLRAPPCTSVSSVFKVFSSPRQEEPDQTLFEPKARGAQSKSFRPRGAKSGQRAKTFSLDPSTES